jgi:hypothetical protein
LDEEVNAELAEPDAERKEVLAVNGDPDRLARKPGQVDRALQGQATSKSASIRSIRNRSPSSSNSTLERESMSNSPVKQPKLPFGRIAKRLEPAAPKPPSPLAISPSPRRSPSLAPSCGRSAGLSKIRLER